MKKLKLHTVLLWIALIIGGSFCYYYITHRNDDCQEMMQCFRSFKDAAYDRFEMMKESIKNMFHKKNEMAE